VEPVVHRWEGLTVADFVVAFAVANRNATRNGCGHRRRRGEKGYDGHAIDIAIVVALQEGLNVLFVNVVEDLFNGLIGNGRVLGGNWALKDADTLRVTVDEGIHILRLP